MDGEAVKFAVKSSTVKGNNDGWQWAKCHVACRNTGREDQLHIEWSCFENDTVLGKYRQVIVIFNEQTHHKNLTVSINFIILTTLNISSQILHMSHNNSTGHFIMFSMITNICNKKTKGPPLMEFFTATGKLKKWYTHRTSLVVKKKFHFSCGCEKFH